MRLHGFTLVELLVVLTIASDVCQSLSIDETGVRGFTGSGSTEEVCWRRGPKGRCRRGIIAA